MKFLGKVRSVDRTMKAMLGLLVALGILWIVIHVVAFLIVKYFVAIAVGLILVGGFIVGARVIRKFYYRRSF